MIEKVNKEIPYDIVFIVWDDAESLEAGWDTPPTTLKESLAMTVGFLVKETKKHVMISHTTDGNNINGRLQIPKGMIKSMKVLHEKLVEK